MKTSRLLRMSSFSLFFMVVSVYVLAYAVNNIYTQQFETEESLSAFFGILTAVTGSLALLIQLLFTNRIICNQGLKKVNYIFPLTSIFSYSFLLFSFSLPAAIFGSFNKETLMPAFAKPVRNIFNSSLPSQLQGRAQAIAVVLVIPLGLAFAGIFLLLTQNIDDIHNFLIVGLACSIALLIFNSEINQEYAKEILSNLKKRLFVPDKYINSFLQGNQKDVIKTLEQGVLSNDDDISIVYAGVLSQSAPDRAALLIPQRIKNSNDSVKDQMIKILQSIESTNSKDSLIEVLGTGDSHLDATILKTLFHSRSPDEKYRVAALLDNAEPRMKAAAIYGVLRYPIPELSEKALTEWGEMLKNEDESIYIPAVDLLTPDFKTFYLEPPLKQIVQQRIRKMLLHDDKYCKKTGLNILSTWPPGSFDNIENEILSLSKNNDCDIRVACINAIALLSTGEREKLLSEALEDHHPNVRDNALKTLSSNQKDDIEYVKQLLTSKHMRSPRSIQTMLKYLMAAGTDASIMQSISLFLADEARKFKDACHFIKDRDRSNSQEMTLLTLTLEERIIDIIDLSLYAVQASNHEEDIAVIRAGLNSNDKRQFSNAYELLTMLNNKKLAKLILPLFDESMSSNKTSNNNLPFKNINELTRWLQDRSDPWLKECANYYSATLDNKSYV
ncbi:MAG: hypothetical protein IZT55_03115 [Anaerolineae bacterium]|nr:hypothetical protein [Anaerolineae bacterium]